MKDWRPLTKMSIDSHHLAALVHTTQTWFESVCAAYVHSMWSNFFEIFDRSGIVSFSCCCRYTPTHLDRQTYISIQLSLFRFKLSVSNRHPPELHPIWNSRRSIFTIYFIVQFAENRRIKLYFCFIIFVLVVCFWSKRASCPNRRDVRTISI